MENKENLQETKTDTQESAVKTGSNQLNVSHKATKGRPKKTRKTPLRLNGRFASKKQVDDAKRKQLNNELKRKQANEEESDANQKSLIIPLKRVKLSEDVKNTGIEAKEQKAKEAVSDENRKNLIIPLKRVKLSDDAKNSPVDPEEQKKNKKKLANEKKLKDLKSKLGLAGGYGNYPSGSTVIPDGGMSKAEAKDVLKLLNLGCKNVNFRLVMSGERNSVQVTEGEFNLKMKVYPDDSRYSPHMDTIDFQLRKKGDPSFKFRAEMQFLTDEGELTPYFPEDNDDLHVHESRGDDWQSVSDEIYLRDYGWRRDMAETYFVRVNVTVL